MSDTYRLLRGGAGLTGDAAQLLGILLNERDALAGENAQLKDYASFVARWATREDPVHAEQKLAPEERLSAIANHPGTRAVIQREAKDGS